MKAKELQEHDHMTRRKSQNKRLKEWLLNGNTITQDQAEDKWKMMRLASRINDLRDDGMRIITVMKYPAKGVRYAEYHYEAWREGNLL